VSVVSDTTEHDHRAPHRTYLERVLIAVGVVTAIGLVLSVLWYGAQVGLLIFAGLLLAVFLRALSNWLAEHTPLSAGWALAVVLVSLAGTIGLGMWLVVPTIARQAQELTQQLPQLLEQLRRQVRQLPFGEQLLREVPQAQQLLPSTSNIVGRVTGIFSTALGILVNIVIIVFVGIYLAADPGLYTRGLVRLVPLRHRPRAREVLDTLGYTLRHWLLGRLAIMALNGALTGLALWWLGVPLAALNGVLTGVLNFIPNIGPFLAAVPAVLLALAQSPALALWVVVLYILIQNLEGFVLTPLVQQRTVDLPPVLIISAQIFFGIVFGFLGILLAVPLTAVVFVLIKMVYVEDTLGDRIEVKGEQQAQQRR